MAYANKTTVTIKNYVEYSIYDEGVGRYSTPPPTIKIRITTNLKTKNNQNGQETELYGSPTTTELKKKNSCRLVGGVGDRQPGRRGYIARPQLAHWEG